MIDWCVTLKCLLTEPKLAFAIAVTIVQAMELAEKSSRELQSSAVMDPPKDLHKCAHLANSKKSSQKHEDVGKDKSSAGICYCCGGTHNQ